MSHRHSLLFVSLALLGSALALLSGCSWENEPAAMEKESKTLALDKLKADPPTEATSTPAAPRPTSPQVISQPLTPMSKPQYPTPPALSINTNQQYQATLSTDKGEIVIALNAKATPVTVNNFVFLAKEQFYDGTIFHRTIPGFMIQGGDPLGTGMGGPGYRFADEDFAGEYKRGIVAMANAGPDTNGSQFFIMHADYALPPNYVIFGQVIKGLEVVDAIATAPTQSGGEGSKPVTPTVVKTVTISE